MRDRIYIAFAFASSALAAFGFAKAFAALAPMGTRDEWAEMGATAIFVCSLILTINGVEYLGDKRRRQKWAEEEGFSDANDFEKSQRESGELAILRRAGRLYAGLPDGTSFDEACRIKAAQGNEEAQYYLKQIERDEVEKRLRPILKERHGAHR